ncbi:SDR family NAD(P)-dependent oxidoreductase [Flagellatimonas centrodinii]|uniref:type I polyketide synthase n=1 Tax=Flagellatimonas centrodinii TaxID=2806210 RepID=UPI001FEED5A1|nr:type I polyketide synthase [Flagellatimonas centrodinii]ULQ46383.1 SDR family NAD(P)-dependent oxidoreductase [Flagellatimonas centrodinii]
MSLTDSPAPPSFEIFGLNPGDLSPRLALALARAGATGVLDLVHAQDAAGADMQFRTLASQTEARIGLRLTSAHRDRVAALLSAVGDRSVVLMLAAEAPEVQRQTAEALRAVHGGLMIWAEVTHADTAAAHDGGPMDGLIALGHEAGGWVGDDTSFILLQKLQGRCRLPIMVRGGIGVRAAAACRAAGAVGVVLDDCLLLLRESPLPATTQMELARLNGAECKLFGERVDTPVRVYGKPSSPALKATEADDRAAEGGQLDVATWRQQLEHRLGWSGRPDQLMPLGQGIGLAAHYRDRHGSVGRLVQALRRASQQQIESAARLGFLDEGAPLATAHGTRFPVVQGPMTRVSDVPDFAVEVARGGALPLLALALMRGPQVREMLEQTRDRIGDQPWGVGLLGFVPHALREEQCAEIWKCPPPFALIAGGRPDQAAEFEKRGIQTYIHAPAPALLRLYLDQGARRFVFEGRECGGHVGPLASFALWEQMIEVLLAEVKPGEEKQVHVLFAGGIHDALSCAMVAAMTAPLAARGMKVGVLMGTAYLFTREIVSTGAIVQGFQDEALRCRRTVNLETGPGHASRCVDTQFAREFFETRRRLIREGRSAEEIRDELEDLNLGRLRIASKGVNRNTEGEIVSIEAAEQLDQGMYMIGQVATLRAEPVAVEALHLEVCRGAQVHLQAWADARADRREKAKPADIAIVGIGTLLPKADGPDAFWHNILHQVRSIGPVPPERWDPELYFDADRKTRDKVYSRWGGFLDEVPFDPMRYGIPPRSMKSIDPMQLLTLEVAQRTLADAGYGDGGVDHEQTSIILGAGGGLGDLGLQYGVRAELPRFVENPDPRVWERLPEWTEESFAGTLLNVAAGRVANRMDFGGLNFTVDAACASSLAAISIAVSELEAGRSNLVLAGGIDTVQSPFGFLCFSKTQALSPTGSPRTFDRAADGIAISEGLAVVALKRLADAERDGDRIYAVIKAVAGSSDGKALGLTAPRPDGQIRAIKRAYAKAGFSPTSLELFEAHGTGTPVGDRAEAETITRALRAEQAAPNTVALGSVKTLVGHTKASAGVAGLIKIALSLYHRVQPAHHGVDNPIDTLAAADTPAYLLKQPRPWVAHPDHPRRAGVSAFGFGGTNFHAVLEEYGGAQPAAAGHDRWPHELLVFSATDRAQLQQQIEQLRPVVAAPGKLMLSTLAFALARVAEGRVNAALRLAVVASDFAGLAQDLDRISAHLRDGQPLPASARLQDPLPQTPPRVAFLFPGQGAQHVNMGREAALYFDEVRRSLELADQVLAGRLPRRLSQYILPPAAFTPDADAAQQAALTDTRVAQPAIGAVSLGYLALAGRLGLKADAAAGHSYGEYVALAAAGVISPADCLRLSAVRGAAMAQASDAAVPGTMAAVQGRREDIDAAIAPFDGVRIANHNAPGQSVISGPRAAVEAAVKALSEAGLRSTLLPVSGAFHTELVADARPPLSAAISETAFQPAGLTVFHNGSGAPYPDTAEAQKSTLDGHLLSSVEFVREINAIADLGCTVFVELGPKSICANMARAILETRDGITTVSLDGQGGGLKGLLGGIADLWARGVDLSPLRLFDGRDLPWLEMADLAKAAVVPALPAHMWMVSGGCARPQGDPERRTGTLPALTRVTADAARQRSEAALATAATPPAPAAAPALVAATPAPSAGSPLGTDALVAYQQTMQQFLALQERVIQQALGMPASASPAAAIALPAAPAPQVSPAVPATAAAVAAPPTVSAPPVVGQPAPVPAAAADVAPALDVRALVLDIVADRTGYPPDMLALDADLEADLGVDSIKRVEIIGAVQKALPAAAGEQIQAQMERFTQARSLQAVIDTLTALVPAAPIAAAAITPTAASPAAAEPALDLRSLLLEIVADRTGYPPDMLALDADLEADLGVDSIKRVEIIGAVQKALPTAAGEQIQAQMERFTQARSLQAVLDALGAVAPAGMTPTATASVAQEASSAPHPAVDIRALLLDIVADRTGYPPDMLALDADLEADLGVDSIKRVEIIGAVQKALPAAAGEQIQAQMERFTQARSLQAVMDALASVMPTAPATPAAAGAAPTTGAVVATAAVDLQSLLLDIVADRTGYPPDMLALDADLEADLGVDSIKRVEIIGAVQKTLPAAVADQLQAQMERFTQARSLQAILAALAGLQPTATTPPAAAVATPATVPTAEATTIPRYVVRCRAAALPPRRVRLTGTALVVAGPQAISDALSARLRAEGLQPVAIVDTQAAAIAAAVQAARKAYGPIAAVLHLSGLHADTDDSSLEGWRAGYQRHLLSMLHLAHALGDDLGAVRLLAGSRLGGSFGRDSVGDGALLAGGLNGVLNCLRHEYPGAVMRAVDFDGQTDAEIVAALCDELLCEDTAPEIGYIGHERVGTVVIEQPAGTGDGLTPSADWVVLATGGARGITAELLESMAVPGMRMVLLGRTAEPADEPAALASLDTPSALRAHLLAEARAAGRTPRPVEIDREISQLQAAREIRNNLARLRAAGCTVDYRPCDVRDGAAFRALIADLYTEHGRIDAVVHGAGVIEDKLIVDKRAESFERVLGTKLDAAQVLAQALQPASLKMLCFFTSVAGRFGNRGQSDYAAANETLNRLAWQLHRRWPDTRVMAINWGPWDAGMASEGVKAAFRAQGIEPIPVAAGRQYFLDELRHGARADVELVAGRGTWGTPADPDAHGVAAAGPEGLPLITHAPRMGPGGAMTLDHVFTADSDPYLLDHRIDGKLVLPAAGAAEWMAQFAAAAWPGWQVSELRDLRQFNGISVDSDGERLIQLRARASSHSDAGTQSITVEMVDPAQKRPCYRATVCLVEQLAEAPLLNLAALTEAQPVTASDAYGRYLFHGPRFRLIDRIDGVSQTGVDAMVRPASVKTWLDRDGSWLFDPGLLDLPPQLAIVWSRIHHDMTALPSAIGRVQRFAGKANGPLKLALRMLPDEQAQSIRYDAWIIDGDGRVRLAIERFEGHMSAALNRLAGEAAPRG